LPFLRALATKVETRATLAGCGYTEEEQAYAWKLLLASSGYVPAPMPTTDDERARAAIVELDAWDEPGFTRIHAALARLHPEQDTFVFAGIEARDGANSVVSVATLLDRLDALQNAPEREPTRTADREALETLRKRGITPAERARLREQVAMAQRAITPVVPLPEPEQLEQRMQTLRELRAWYVDWSTTARSVIRRRDHLILMGLGKRSSSKRDDQDGTTVPESPPSVVVSPA
jgi:hypothetical protein